MAGRFAQHHRLVVVCALAGGVLLGPDSANAGDSARVLEDSGCASCHRLEPPEPAEVTVEALSQRRGPDLFYAGVKYRPEWLRRWLVEPTQLRPAGMFPAANTKPGGESDDIVDGSKLTPHVPVAAEELEAIVSALGGLRWGTERVAQPPPDLPAVPPVLAKLNFEKFKGCGSCHRVAPDAGGVSGPELYSSFDRLQPAFLWSYLEDPQAWDAVAPMPDYGLQEGEVGKLIAYLATLSEGQR